MRRVVLKLPDISIEEQLHTFVRGLKPSVKLHVEVADPKTLDAAIRMAERINACSYPSGGFSREAARKGGATPMELGALDDDGQIDGDDEQIAALERRPTQPFSSPSRAPATRDRPAPLTPEERIRCRDNNLCFRCRKPGHAASNCRTFPSAGPNGVPSRV